MTIPHHFAVSKQDRRHMIFAIASLLALGFMLWGARSLWDSSEARYGQVALEMLTSGNWIVPTLAGEPHLTKPPFAYWMIAAGMRLWGVNAWGARFFLAVLFTGTLFCIQALAQTMGYPRRTALWAALIFGTSLLPFAGGHVLTTDAFLTFWETLGILAAWKVWQSRERSATVWRLVFWGAFGMGFFTKGPPAWLPLIAVAAFGAIRRDPQRPRLLSATGMVLFLGLSFWWYAVVIAQDPSRLAYFINDEIVGRVATTMHDRNQPFWLYAPVILFGVGPWVVLWPTVAARTWTRLRAGSGRLTPRHLFILLWFAIPLAVFTLSRSRMPLYVMPLFAPLSLVMAEVWTQSIAPRLQASPGRWRAMRIGFAVWILLLVVFTAYPDTFPGSRSRRPAARMFAKVLDAVDGPYHIYWAHAGRQKYGIAFYLGTLIPDADDFDRHPSSLEPAGAAGQERIFYITRARLAPDLERRSVPPMVHAKTADYALIEWPHPDATTDSVPALAGAHRSALHSGPDASPRHRFSSPRSKFFVALLLMLAEGRY